MKVLPRRCSGVSTPHRAAVGRRQAADDRETQTEPSELSFERLRLLDEGSNTSVLHLGRDADPLVSARYAPCPRPGGL